MPDRLVAVRGGGDLGSGVALRLWRCGFRVVILETGDPRAVRRTVSFSEAVYDGRTNVEEAQGVLAGSVDQALDEIARNRVPVLVDPELRLLPQIRPHALVDAVMAKRNLGIEMHLAPFVVALGPGFQAGVDVHAVVETNRGPDLGRVIWTGEAEPDTGEPGEVGGARGSRVLRAPAKGRLRACRDIGQVVEAGDPVAAVDGLPVVAAISGVVRGLARDGLQVETGMKVGDIDPRFDPSLCLRVSDKAMAIAGGVLEAILMSMRRSE